MAWLIATWIFRLSGLPRSVHWFTIGMPNLRAPKPLHAWLQYAYPRTPYMDSQSYHWFWLAILYPYHVDIVNMLPSNLSWNYIRTIESYVVVVAYQSQMPRRKWVFCCISCMWHLDLYLGMACLMAYQTNDHEPGVNHNTPAGYAATSPNDARFWESDYLAQRYNGRYHM